ncbi:MAG: protocatechuate 3,4-dioxygenase subunit alpha [Alphaproteobacteria bacterium]|nr:protocatechuate 3,4-dioxygenase subunit alpha [Alphaproteobacteria bacterium]
MPVEPLKETPSQTAGPYVHIGTWPSAAGLPIRTQEKPNVMVGAGARGERIRIEGLIYDGAGSIVTDAMLELWHADADGKFPGHFGRTITDLKTGEWFFETVKPGATKLGDGRPEAPFGTIVIFARGINIHLQTRVYFSDEEKANAADPALKAVAEPKLQKTLIAARTSRNGQTVYRFDIRLQGDDETVFFDI